MDKTKIEIITCDSGDWYVLKINGKISHEGHDIPKYVWVELLQSLGCDVEKKYITDEEMENRKY